MFEIIGFSEKNKPLIVIYPDNKDGTNTSNSAVIDGKPLKIFIMAGQHGDEDCGRKATNVLIPSLARDFDINLSLIQLAILTDTNPDGSFQNIRINANGVDLNRDHQLLNSKEIRSIHSFVRSWEPHIIIDVHNYPPRRKHLLAKNLIYCHDIFIDIPTNPSISCALDQAEINDFLKSVQSDLKLHNFSCDRYAVIKPSGKVRHSTPDIIDARNSLSLRYNTFTILLEGRQPTRKEGKSNKDHIVSAQNQAIRSILKFVIKYKKRFLNPRYLLPPSEGDIIAIRSKYRSTDKQFLQMSFQNSITKSIDTIDVSDYIPYVKVTKYIKLPIGYAVPLDKKNILKVLARHGFISCFYSSSNAMERVIEKYAIQSLEPSTSKNRTPRKISTLTIREWKNLADYIVFPITQKGGHSLAIFLEPKSKYALHRYSELNLPIIPGTYYPILRLVG